MKKTLLFLIFFLTSFFAAVPCCAAEVDPILIDEPNEKVFGCKNDVFFELLKEPTISKVASGRTAAGYYLIMEAEVLFLIDGTWNGIDRQSFLLRWTDPDGKVTLYPLDYAISMISNLKVSWYTFTEPFHFTDLRKTTLIFDVEPYTKEGWTLLFRPTERGSGTSYCEIEIPLTVK